MESAREEAVGQADHNEQTEGADLGGEQVELRSVTVRMLDGTLHTTQRTSDLQTLKQAIGMKFGRPKEDVRLTVDGAPMTVASFNTFISKPRSDIVHCVMATDAERTEFFTCRTLQQLPNIYEELAQVLAGPIPRSRAPVDLGTPCVGTTAEPQDARMQRVVKTATAANTRKLRIGTFAIDSEDGANVDFTFVPDGFRLAGDSNDAEEVLYILRSIGIGALPHVAFEFNHGNLLASTTAPEDLKLAIIGCIESVLEELTTQLSPTSAVYVLTRPFRGNRLSELACQAAKNADAGRGVPVLGLFLNMTCHDGTVESALTEPAYAVSDTPSAAIDLKYPVKLWSKSRFSLPASWLATHTVVWTESDPAKPEHRFVVCSQYTHLEEQRFHDLGTQAIDGGLISDVTHALVFETEAQRERFRSMFCRVVKSGAVVAGGSQEMLHSAVKCLKKSRPLIVFERTSGAADLLTSMKPATVPLSQHGFSFDAPESEDLGHAESETSSWYSAVTMQPSLQPGQLPGWKPSFLPPPTVRKATSVFRYPASDGAR